ncbi:MAG: Gfo/Idh/MocA family oxidoreductase [Anaerolineae bacterium]|jgi:predicted dehydrogenase|nr:Gfo/Idh/MocA family oxidoreductase [Anaerolineae bacterium]
MTKIAFVGCAHIHVPDFIRRVQGQAAVTVKAVWDHDADRAARRAAELNAAVVSDVADIWADPEIAGVVIGSETNRHEPLVLAGAAARKHLFVEKPLGMGARDAYAMAAAIEAAGILFQTGYFMRGEPVHQFLRRHIQQGSFGRITRIRHINCHSGSLGGWFDTEWRWMADVQQAGVGAFGDLGTHSLDILLWLLGDVQRVTADLDIVTGRYAGCDEYGEALIKFKNGTTGTLAAGWVDVAQPVRLALSGTEGHAHLADDKLYFKSSHVAGADGQTPWTDLPAQQAHPFDQFLQALTGTPGLPLITAREAATRAAVMEAMYQGWQQRTWIDL